VASRPDDTNIDCVASLDRLWGARWLVGLGSDRKTFGSLAGAYPLLGGGGRLCSFGWVVVSSRESSSCTLGKRCVRRGRVVRARQRVSCADIAYFVPIVFRSRGTYALWYEGIPGRGLFCVQRVDF